MKRLVISLLIGLCASNVFAGEDALDEVNAYRAARGLPAFQRDDSLSEAAIACATYRAANRIHGHTNDFAFLPQGSWADATGAEGNCYWAPNCQWATCCSKENWQYAGAGYAIGPDGQRYMSLFVAHRPNATQYYWAYDPQGGGYDCCYKSHVIGYLYPSGKYKVRYFGKGGPDVWDDGKPPIALPR